MKQVLIRQGKVFVEEVPAPGIEPGCVLVRVDHSCLSVGTELSGLKASGAPLWRRALRHPEKAARALRILREEGFEGLRDRLEGKLAAGEPTGYSAAGTVLEAGAGVEDLFPGDRVACAGAQWAHHAEIVRVPRNLVVPLPEGLDFPRASTATLGAIALQGVRRLEPTLGETFAVLGLGVLGQLAVQILRANGCHVVGSDPDPRRRELALSLGLDAAVDPAVGDGVERVARLTGGLGADGVLITASTPSNAVASTAFRMCRRKGRVVLVGDVGLSLDRADLYAKELDFRISTSYGPGRYDRRYEEEGLDYPPGYVRWTENRNLEAYLGLVAEGKVRLDPLIQAVFPLEEAPAAYAALQSGGERPLMVLLRYASSGEIRRRVPNPRAKKGPSGRVRLAVVGAGAFARGTHLPNLRRLSDLYDLRCVVGRSGASTQAAAEQFGAAASSTDLDAVLSDGGIDAVLIATRHHLHALQALAALRAGKHVLVEKPLCLSQEELEEFRRFFEEAQTAGREVPVLLTGYNRRFSEYARRMREAFRNRTNPIVLNYRMNAGYLPPHHWTQGKEGGGRNLGEACHVYDLFRFLTGAPVKEVLARPLRPRTAAVLSTDNFAATLTFADGSLATLTYTALGSRDHPKERLEIYGEGRVVELADYRSLTDTGVKLLSTRLPEKGHLEELRAFAQGVRSGSWPIPPEEQWEVAQTALRVQEALVRGGCPE